MCLSAMADTYEFPHEVAEEHGAIVDAIRARDQDRLFRLLDDHMDDALNRLTTAYAELVED
jgi:DNA-binding GntR family transcriptional regulator